MMWILLPIVIICDQLVKLWVISAMTEYDAVTLIPHVLDITRIHNPGAVFGFLSEYNNVIAVIAMITSCAIVVYVYLNRDMPKFLSTGLILVSGGAISNIIDRLVHNSVIDFISLRFMNFPIFNFADISITCGAAIIIWFVLRGTGEDGALKMSLKEDEILKTNSKENEITKTSPKGDSALKSGGKK